MKMIEPKGQLEACRQQAEAAPKGVTEWLLRPSRSDWVKIEFDWQMDSPIQFQVRISRRDQYSAISFTIDLSKLTGTDLQKLHDFLVGRPKGYWLIRKITWLLDISLVQQMPFLSEENRHAKVRELLLAGE